MPRSRLGDQMDQFEGLQTIAEVGVGIAGFGGIIVAITRGREEWESWDEIRIWGVLVPSISAVLLALLPLGLNSAGLASDALPGGAAVLALV